MILGCPVIYSALKKVYKYIRLKEYYIIEYLTINCLFTSIMYMLGLPTVVLCISSNDNKQTRSASTHSVTQGLRILHEKLSDSYELAAF